MHRCRAGSIDDRKVRGHRESNFLCHPVNRRVMLEKPRVSQYNIGRRSERRDEELDGMLSSAGESDEERGVLIDKAVRGD